MMSEAAASEDCWDATRPPLPSSSPVNAAALMTAAPGYDEEGPAVGIRTAEGMDIEMMESDPGSSPRPVSGPVCAAVSAEVPLKHEEHEKEQHDVAGMGAEGGTDIKTPGNDAEPSPPLSLPVSSAAPTGVLPREHEKEQQDAAVMGAEGAMDIETTESEASQCPPVLSSPACVTVPAGVPIEHDKEQSDVACMGGGTAMDVEVMESDDVEAWTEAAPHDQGREGLTVGSDSAVMVVEVAVTDQSSERAAGACVFSHQDHGDSIVQSDSHSAMGTEVPSQQEGETVPMDRGRQASPDDAAGSVIRGEASAGADAGSSVLNGATEHDAFISSAIQGDGKSIVGTGDAVEQKGETQQGGETGAMGSVRQAVVAGAATAGSQVIAEASSDGVADSVVGGKPNAVAGRLRRKRRRESSPPPGTAPQSLVEGQSDQEAKRTTRTQFKAMKENGLVPDDKPPPRWAKINAADIKLTGEEFTLVENALLTQGFAVIKGGLNRKEVHSILNAGRKDGGAWKSIMGENCYPANYSHSGREMKVLVEEGHVSKVARLLDKKLKKWLRTWGTASRTNRRGATFTLSDMSILRSSEECTRDQHRHRDFVTDGRYPARRLMSCSLIAGLTNGNKLNVWSLGCEEGKCVCAKDGTGSCAPHVADMVLTFDKGDIVLIRADLLHGGVKREAVDPSDHERLHMHLVVKGMPVAYDRLGLA